MAQDGNLKDGTETAPKKWRASCFVFKVRKKWPMIVICKNVAAAAVAAAAKPPATATSIAIARPAVQKDRRTEEPAVRRDRRAVQ